MAAAARALLLQTANPLVAQGALDHSSFDTDPYGRFERTVHWVTLTSFGTRREALRVSRGVSALHRRVVGRLPAESATAAVRGGTAYSGTDPTLLRWVHAGFVDTMLVAHDALVGGLSGADRDRFVVEWNRVAALMGVPRRLHFRDAGHLRRYLRRELRSGRALPGQGSRRIAETVLHPPLSTWAARPGSELLSFIAVGLLPPEIRDAYGLAWSPAHDLAHAATCLWVRGLQRTLPRRLRVAPVHDLAKARAEGRRPSQLAA
jgi:uncharacterized protein (DUF2236 family)